jgi:ribosomal protein L11 methyltransferase
MVRVRAGADRDAVLAALFDAGSQGVQEEGDALLTHFPPETSVDDVRAAIRAASDRAEIEIGATPSVDWSEAWKSGLRPHSLGRITVAPPWLATSGERTIIIDPGMAFGTGEHPTTRSVVRLMQGVIRPGDRVADLGAGSAVLGIVAAKLGAASVAAIEMDPDAIGNGEENIERNGVGGVVRLLEGDAALLLPLVAPVRVVLANIIFSVLTELLPIIAESLAADGRAILSGILVEERGDMCQVLESSRWRVVAEETEEIWWSAVVARR